MDINPYEFTAPFEDFEFSSFQKKEEVDLIAFSTNWTVQDVMTLPPDIVKDTINYWAQRLTPLIKSKEKKCYFLAAGRTGKEKTTLFVGIA
jgi:protein N-terminal amidase